MFYHIAIRVDSQTRLPDVYANCSGALSRASGQALLERALQVQFANKYSTSTGAGLPKMAPKQFEVQEVSKRGSVALLSGECWLTEDRTRSQWFVAELRVPRGKPSTYAQRMTVLAEEAALQFVEDCSEQELVAYFGKDGYQISSVG